jgi:hypothetical protein
MDSGQLFSVFNEWTNRLEYVIESGGEYYTKSKRFALVACLFAKIERGLTTFWPPYLSIVNNRSPELVILTNQSTDVIYLLLQPALRKNDAI